jgi:prohibitin 2
MLLYRLRLQLSPLTGLLLVPDLQMVNMRLRVLFKPEWAALPKIFQDIGPDYHEKVLPSIVNEILKSTVVSEHILIHPLFACFS